MDIDALTRKIRGSLPGLMAVYLFGSRARGEATRDSDLDLAVLMERRGDPLEFFYLAGELGAVAGCPIDLVDLRAASTVMQYQVVTTGQVLWSRDFETGIFESFVLSSKTELDRARAALVEDITKEGRIRREKIYAG
ncbi:toxin-antitoxin system antidote Mnt family protein [Synergistales bacterium]|nr:toxin-antitoxin system antidote Mnt family protein [Synergistales bacterium]